MFRVIGLMVAVLAAAAQAPLRIVVIEGEDAVNVIQQNTAVAPVIEVRDRNDLPVAGAVVTFTIQGGQTASFGGASTLSVATNAAGQATAAGLTPLTSGAFQIEVSAAFQGQVATATIAQTNVVTVAQAAGATGASGASGATSATGATGGTASATGAAGAGAVGAAAGVAAGSGAAGGAAAAGAAAAGGGLSATTIGIVGAAVGGGALAVTRVGQEASGEEAAEDGPNAQGGPVRETFSGPMSGQSVLNSVTRGTTFTCTMVWAINATVTLELDSGIGEGIVGRYEANGTETIVSHTGCGGGPPSPQRPFQRIGDVARTATGIRGTQTFSGPSTGPVGPSESTGSTTFDGTRSGDTVAANLSGEIRTTTFGPGGAIFDGVTTWTIPVTLTKTGERRP